MKKVSLQKWRANEENKGVLIDVRTPLEYGSEHAEASLSLPLDQVSLESLKKLTDDSTIALICKSGTRASLAAEKLKDQGLEIYVLEGGMDAWIAQGLPTVYGKKAMSLERQVRIAAGALVLSGAVLSLLGFSYMVYLSGFVGAGLIFAGLTDTCAMGLLIAKMPWNQKGCC